LKVNVVKNYWLKQNYGKVYYNKEVGEYEMNEQQRQHLGNIQRKTFRDIIVNATEKQRGIFYDILVGVMIRKEEFIPSEKEIVEQNKVY